MPTAQFVPDLAALHQHLACNPSQPQRNLDIRIASAPDGIYAYINDAGAIRLSDIGTEHTEVHFRQLWAMLCHYPAPVHINDRPIETKPYQHEPGIRVLQHQSSLLHPDPTFNTILQGKGYPAILLDQVLYELDTSPAAQKPGNADYAGALEYRIADHQDRQPHFARRTTYQILPTYRYQPADLTSWRFREGYGYQPHRCLPPADVMHVLANSQRTPQETAGADFIHQHSGGSPAHGRFQRLVHPQARKPDDPHTYTTRGWSLPLVTFGQQVNIDQDEQQEQPVNLSVARCLYATPELSLVPVQMRSHDLERPNVTCQAVTVITAAGAVLELHRAPRGRDFEFVLPGGAPAEWETGCRQITATLAVTDPDGTSRQVLLPMDAFLSGDVEEENIWLTADWTADRTDELKDLLFLAYWPELEDPEHITYCQYRKRVAAMAGNLLQSPAKGLTLELKQLADEFSPLSDTSGQAIIWVARPRHSLIWQPEHSEDIPVWLTAAIAGLSPGAEPATVGQQARAILTDPVRLGRLQELLAITPAA